MRLRSVAAAVVAAAFIGAFRPSGVSAADERSFTTWSEYLGGADSSQYSSLKQITKSNVKQLDQVWTYPAGVGTSTFNPIVADGVMYVIAKSASTIVALDAATGKEIWSPPKSGQPDAARH